MSIFYRTSRNPHCPSVCTTAQERTRSGRLRAPRAQERREEKERKGGRPGGPQRRTAVAPLAATASGLDGAGGRLRSDLGRDNVDLIWVRNVGGFPSGLRFILVPPGQESASLESWCQSGIWGLAKAVRGGRVPLSAPGTARPAPSHTPRHRVGPSHRPAASRPPAPRTKEGRAGIGTGARGGSLGAPKEALPRLVRGAVAQSDSRRGAS